jgi:four helix bundle protein
MHKENNLEKRTLEFSKNIINLIKRLNKELINNILCRQLLRSATSIGANYREANEAVTKKDFKNKIVTSRKEAKETVYWLDLLQESNKTYETNVKALREEAYELLKIFASIAIKAS